MKRVPISVVIEIDGIKFGQVRDVLMPDAIPENKELWEQSMQNIGFQMQEAITASRNAAFVGMTSHFLSDASKVGSTG